MDKSVRCEVKQLGLAGPCNVRDIWAKRDLSPVTDAISIAPPPPHGAVLLRVSQKATL